MVVMHIFQLTIPIKQFEYKIIEERWHVFLCLSIILF